MPRRAPTSSCASSRSEPFLRARRPPLTAGGAITLALTAAILAVSAFVQSAVGFGMGLVAIPLLLWAGLSLPEAVATVHGAGAMQTGVGLWRGRAWIRPGLSLGVLAAQCVGMPLGVATMVWLSQAGQGPVQQAAGAGVLLAVALRALVRPVPRPQVAWPWRGVAGVTSGALSGAIGMGGPPLVLLALAHDWPAARFRVFLWTQILWGMPPVLALLVWQFGPTPLASFGIGLAHLPVIWLAAHAGHALTGAWPAHRVQRAATLLLCLLGLSSLLGPLL